MKFPVGLKCEDCGSVDFAVDEEALKSAGTFGCGKCCGGKIDVVQEDVVVSSVAQRKPA